MLKPLQKIIQEVSGISNLDVALNTIVHQIRTVLWVDVCSVYLADEDGTLSLMATDGLKLESGIGVCILGKGTIQSLNEVSMLGKYIGCRNAHAVFNLTIGIECVQKLSKVIIKKVSLRSQGA